ncbi:beta-ketoacyl synthase N-terminal-like domain-containing protein [Lentzea sp. NPDC042327]|uniref:beta-ketoacyl synthase N-terminal-like domain-containing protein n=1 Tax=Lentzea sp. NPDC042327 TaxID=3154801 RepID=UPI003409E9E1
MTTLPAGTTVVGSATITTGDLAEHTANKPSFYADPAAWLVAATAHRALTDSPADVLAGAEDTGVLVMSANGSRDTLRAIARSLPRVSPLRFAGANPGVLAGLPCLRWGLRGPSLLLAAHPDAAAGVAFTVADGWLRTGQARHVLLIGLQTEPGGHLCRCLVLSTEEVPPCPS